MNKLQKLTKSVIFISLFLLFFQVMVANRLTTAGSTFSRLLERKESLDQDNDLLAIKIASASSLAQITQISQQQGFIKPYFLYFENQVSVALSNLTTNVAR